MTAIALACAAACLHLNQHFQLLTPLTLFILSCAVFILLKTELHVSLKSIANPLLLGRL